MGITTKLSCLFATLSVICAAPIAFAQFPQGLRGTLIVVNKSGHDASFIDLGSGEILETLPTGRGPHELIVTDDGRWAIGTDYSSGNSLTVFDVEELLVARTISLRDYPRPHGILFLPGQKEVIVTSEASQQLVIVDFHEGEVVGAIDTGQSGSHMVALSEDGATAYTSNGSANSVSVIDVVSGQLLKTIDVPEGPEAITTNKLGDEVWVGSNDEGVVSVISAASGEISQQWNGFSWPYRILLTDDEKYAVMPDLGNEQLRFFDVNSGTEMSKIDLAGAQPQGVTLYPDDRTLFVSLSGQDKVLVVNILTQEILGEYAAGNAPDGIGYSPLVLRKTISY
ncbi:MAG: YVTN family beta-propeller protein [Kiritimatiellia bacterium]|jgi:YVTN family beta-propeller protein